MSSVNWGPKLSIISPCYMAEKMVEMLVSRIKTVVEPLTNDYEIILVNDCSPDSTWEKIREICTKDNRVKGINLSRNFGQHYAITAGLSLFAGEWAVVMDCDLQDRPEEIPNLYRKALEGYDIVYAKRNKRHDSFLKKLSSTIFHTIYKWLSGAKIDKSIANFGIYKAVVINEFNKMPEYSRSFGSLIRYLGFHKTAIEVQHSARAEGKTSYTLYKLLKLSFDVIITNSNRPLYLAVILGLCMSMLAFIAASYNIVAKFIGIIQIHGYTTTIFSIWFVGGVLLLMMGILGLYIAKIFDQVKGRQLFIIKETLNI